MQIRFGTNSVQQIRISRVIEIIILTHEIFERENTSKYLSK